MNNDITDKRQKATSIAHAYMEHQITWQNFMDETAKFTDDKLIDELVDLIEHEPKRGGFMGVNEKEWYEYQQGECAPRGENQEFETDGPPAHCSTRALVPKTGSRCKPLQVTNMTPIRSTKTNVIRTTLIAPCGMNCRLCCAYTRDKKACPGCRGDNSVKPKTRVTCRIKNCENI